MIQKIKIKNKEYPIRISYSVLRKLKADGLDITKIDEGDFDIYMPMLLYALQSGAKAEDTECEFTIEQMEDALDDCFMEFVKLVPLFFQQWTEGVSQQTPLMPRGERRKLQRKNQKGPKK